MAHLPHAKTPKLNALLIGKRTVPSGCRVINVSQQGMSLQCNPDGRLLTFRSGDSVDIYLSVEHANGHNKFTIPAIVSHVDENTIDVVFHCTDTELAGLIESYRTSKTHNLEATIDHRRVSRNEHPVKPYVVNDNSNYSEQAVKTVIKSSRAFFTGLLLMFIVSLILLAGYYYAASINKRLNTLETVTRSHTDELAEVQTQVFSSRLQDGRYASLNARMKALTDAFQSFEKRMAQALPQEPPVIVARVTEQMVSEATVTPMETQKTTASRETSIAHVDDARPRAAPRNAIAPPAPVENIPTKKQSSTPTTDNKASEELRIPSTQKYPVIVTRPIKQAAVAPSQSAPKSEVPTRLDNPVKGESKYKQIPHSQPSPVVSTDAIPVASPDETRKTTPVQAQETEHTHSGPWAINLLSSPDKAYVDNALAEAQSKGIAAVTTGAKVKGRQYWRLQIPGFESMAAAKIAAEPIKEQMKIKEVWILKR
jgi:hypothetical protein